MLRRLLLLGLVAACFAVMLANRMVTATASHGFEIRIRASLHHEAVLAVPFLKAGAVSRGRVDAAHLDLLLQRAMLSGFGKADVTLLPHAGRSGHRAAV